MSYEDYSGIETTGNSTVQFTCPICHSDRATVNQRLLQIPYYEDFHAITIHCPDCGFRQADFANLNSKGPMRYEYKISTAKDITTKLVRSIYGVVEIPELGITIKPATSPTSWIRNIEGILLDMKEKVEFLMSHGETVEIRQKAKERIELIEEALESKIAFTLSVRDPEGNSVIIPADASKLVVEQIESFDPFEEDNN